jgi:glutathione synthase
MRKDPPFDMEYIYSTYLLEQAQAAGVLVVNNPQSLRDANEKLYTAWFPQCCPPTLVTRHKHLIREFQQQHGELILKPLDGMGGASIFRVAPGDPNLSVMIETLTDHGKRSVMVQQYIPEIVDGDKRILMIDGKPVDFALARIPAAGETRGNLAAGGRAEARPLTDRDRWICDQVGAKLREKGLIFVGLDVIGDYLTEINVTSPTCIRELDRDCGLDIACDLIKVIEQKL